LSLSTPIISQAVGASILQRVLGEILPFKPLVLKYLIFNPSSIKLLISAGN
jgi:hypothetical protein